MRGPPSEERAIAAMQKIQTLGPGALDQRIDEVMGQPMLGVCSAFAQALFPEDDPRARAKKVHLMVLACLTLEEAQESTR